LKESFIVAGPNGAGKTTFAQEFVAEQPRSFLSADVIAARLNPADPTEARLQAGRTFFAALDAHIHQGASFVVESTLAGRVVSHVPNDF
jgi:predicted ABC-type ATPase